MYRSLKMRVAEVSKRMSPVERRETVKRNGLVWIENVRSEDSLEMVALLGKVALPMLGDSSKTSPDTDVGRGMMSWGTSHRGWSTSVMRTWSRLSVSRLHHHINTKTVSLWCVHIYN